MSDVVTNHKEIAMNTDLTTIDLRSLDDVTGAGGYFDYLMQQKQHPTTGGGPSCHFNWKEVGAWTAGGAIAGAKGGWVGAGLGALGGAVGDIGGQIANGACSPKKK